MGKRKQLTNQNNDANERQPVSLLENESRGGDTGEGGINFQAMVVLSYIPLWLSYEGFAAFVRESIGDTEAKFFQPGRGDAKIFVEAKNHDVAPVEFWEEIERFMRVDREAPGEYTKFILASTGVAEGVQSIAKGLRRVRGPQEFYENSAILENSFDAYAKHVEKKGKLRETAEFLYKKVVIDDRFNRGDAYGEFVAALSEHQPILRDLPQSAMRNIYERLKTFVQSRLNQTITRRELEQNIEECLPTNFAIEKPRVRIRTAISKDDADARHTELVFDWQQFFDKTQYPATAVWNDKLLAELRQTKEWTNIHRHNKRILLGGSRRLSVAIALGAVFSAVAGFTIEMTNRGEEVWATNAHATIETPPYEISSGGTFLEKKGERLIVSVAIIRPIADAVEQNLNRFGLANSPTLHLFGAAPVTSAEQANLIAGQLKCRLDNALLKTDAKIVDLFFAGPSALALFFGHRLNAIRPIQCYEWIEPASYIKTCLLK